MIQTFSTGYIYCSQGWLVSLVQNKLNYGRNWTYMFLKISSTYAIVLLYVTNSNSAWQE